MVKWIVWIAAAVTVSGIPFNAMGEPRRPQEEAIAHGPRPYSDKEVSFLSNDGGVKLAGTLSVPNGKGPFPAVVLIAAAGPEDRREDAEGHLVFVVLADHLLRKGVAVLRYDKRGVGASTGDFAKATFADRVSDAHEGFRYLASRAEVDPRRVGVIGHSEGGSIAPAVAAMDRNVAFVVALAGSGLSGEFRLINHEVYLAQLAGAPLEQQSKVLVLCDRIFRVVAALPDDVDAGVRISSLIDAAVAARLLKSTQAQEMRGLFTVRVVREALTDFPLSYLQKVKVPVLALVGSLDRTVPAGPYAEVMRPVLAAIPDSRLEVLPDLNHVMQTARTGAFSEFGTIEETLAPVVLQTMTDWITTLNSRARPARGR